VRLRGDDQPHLSSWLAVGEPAVEHHDGVHRLGHDIARAYSRHIVDAGKEGEFLVLASFLVTFVIVRLITHAIRADRGPLRNMSVRGRHIHHLVPGILLLLITGYLAVAIDSEVGRRTIALFFGVGAALTLDEFALWVDLRDVYWEREGRRSIDAVVIAASLAGVVLVGSAFWADAARAVGRLVGG
jgi:hypothetical protein